MKFERTAILRILLALFSAAGMLATSLIAARGGLSESTATTLVLTWLVPATWAISPGRSPRASWRCLLSRLRRSG